MRLHFITVRRVPPVPSPVLVEAFSRLERRGFTVDAGIPEEALARADQTRSGHELYLLKSHTELALSLAGNLHAQGARLLNPYPSCASAQDKILAVLRLRAAGVPVPRTWVTADLSLLAPVVDDGPLVVKPHRGHRGAGVAVVADRGALADLAPPESPVVIQDYVPGPGEDLKIYVVGDEVFAVRKPFAADSFTRPGRPCPLSDEIRDIALRCGTAFGLGLYGLDVIEGDDGPVVVDLNHFPGYKGVPHAAALIADHVEGYARGRIELELPALLSGAPLRPPTAVPA